jgi:hypothetical protein
VIPAGSAPTRTAPLGLALLLGLVAGFAVSQRSAAAQDAPSGTATFGELSAAPTFPTTIDFRMSAESKVEIVRAELLFAPQWEETLNLIQAEITPGQHVDVSFPLDMYQNFFPTGLDLLYRWRITDAGGNQSVSEEQTVLWLDTRFSWQQIATEQVSVKFYTGNELFNRRILDSAQKTIDDLQSRFGVERSRPIRIWVYDSYDDFSGAQEPNSEPWFVGASFPGRYLIQAVIPTDNDSEIGRIIPHEVTHQLVYQATENPFLLPARWFDEGLATYYQDTPTPGLPEALSSAVQDGRLIPLAALSREFPFDPSYHLAYAESVSVVEFMIAQWGEAAVGNVIAAYRDGVSHDEAFKRGLGVTVGELEQLWRDSLGYTGDRPTDDGTGGAVLVLDRDHVTGSAALGVRPAVPDHDAGPWVPAYSGLGFSGDTRVRQ